MNCETASGETVAHLQDQIITTLLFIEEQCEKSKSIPKLLSMSVFQDIETKVYHAVMIFDFD